MDGTTTNEQPVEEFTQEQVDELARITDIINEHVALLGKTLRGYGIDGAYGLAVGNQEAEAEGDGEVEFLAPLAWTVDFDIALTVCRHGDDTVFTAADHEEQEEIGEVFSALIKRREARAHAALFGEAVAQILSDDEPATEEAGS